MDPVGVLAADALRAEDQAGDVEIVVYVAEDDDHDLSCMLDEGYEPRGDIPSPFRSDRCDAVNEQERVKWLRTERVRSSLQMTLRQVDFMFARQRVRSSAVFGRDKACVSLAFWSLPARTVCQNHHIESSPSSPHECKMYVGVSFCRCGEQWNDVPVAVGELHSRVEPFSAEFKQGGGTNYIDDHEALKLCSPGHPKRFVSLTWLSIHLSDGYKQLGSTEDLNEAIVVGRDALALCTLGHRGHWRTLEATSMYRE